MTVYLVGAGPGDPELITVKAARLIAQADVIVHDRLADDSIIQLAAPGVDLIDVGKKPGTQRHKKPSTLFLYTSALKVSMWCASKVVTLLSLVAVAKKLRHLLQREYPLK